MGATPSAVARRIHTSLHVSTHREETAHVPNPVNGSVMCFIFLMNGSCGFVLISFCALLIRQMHSYPHTTPNITRRSVSTRVANSLFVQNVVLVVMHASFATLTFVYSSGGAPLPLFDTTIGVGLENEVQCALDVANRSASCAASCAIRIDQTVRPASPLPYRQLAVLFSLLSCFFHFGNAFLWRRVYYGFLEQARNPVRWLEYGLSAPCMFICLAWPAGMSHKATLATSAVLIAVTMAFGDLAEDANRPAPQSDTWAEPLMWKRLKAHALGWVPQSVAWYTLLDVFSFTLSQGPDGDEARGPPEWVQALGVIQLLLFSSFGIVQFVLIRFGRPSHYVYGEYAYNLLSLVSKGTLSVMLVGYSAFTTLVDDIDALLAVQTFYRPCEVPYS